MTDERDKKRRKRKLVLLAIWAALIVAAILWVRCGSGWGIGGGSGSGKGRGSDSDSGSGSGSGSAQKRCQIRVTVKGIEVDGKVGTREQAVAACKQGADVVITGDAPQGEWLELQRSFDAAHIGYNDAHPARPPR